MHERRMNGRAMLAALYGAAVAGTDPRRAVARALHDSAVRRILSSARRVGAFAVGKAAAEMLAGARGAFGEALLVLPRGHPAPPIPDTAIVFAAHPEPDRTSVAAGRRALAFFRGFARQDAILCLVSGGASALLEVPRKDLSIAELRRDVRRRSGRGVSIVELNRRRVRLSAIKGGRLGRATRARLITLVLSDVPGDSPRVVGSGPTVRRDPKDVVRVVGTNRDGLVAAARRARAVGLVPKIRTRRLSGEARRAGEAFGRAAARLPAGGALLAGGETTVALGRRPGKGGRSLELALGAAQALDGVAGIFVLAAGSDGRDGTSRFAGAFADGATERRAREAGLDPERALAAHDTAPFFAALGDAFETGPTGTNVADWAFAVRIRKRRPV